MLRCFFTAVAALLVSAAAESAYAQLQIRPDASQKTYNLRIVNDTGRAICLKLEGYGKSRSYHADLRRGDSARQAFYGGMRVAMVWDDRSGELLMVDTLDINKSGTVRLPPLDGGLPGASSGEPKAMAKPSLQISD